MKSWAYIYSVSGQKVEL